MPSISEFIREGPAYKKAILAVAMTAGVGAIAYIGYRRLSQGQTASKPSPSPRGPPQVGEKDTSKPASEKTIPAPSKEKGTTPTGGEHVTPKPTGDKGTGKTVGEKVTPQPSGGKATPQPSGGKATPQPSGEKVTPQPIGEKVTPQPEKATPHQGGEKVTPRPGAERATTQPDKKEPSKDSQEHLSGKDDATRSVLTDKSKSPSKAKDASKGGSHTRAEELTMSGTYEKISIGSGESDNFEHLSMSQVHKPDPIALETAEKGREENLPSRSLLQDKRKTETSSLHQPGTSESMSISQADPSMSFISTSEVEESKKPETIAALQPSDTWNKTEEKTALRDKAPPAASSGVKVKDENDIVVVEKNVEESDTSSEKSEEFRGPRSGMASAEFDFDASRISPVFGGQTYRRVSVEEDELSTFDPAKHHPAAFGFKFDSQN